MTGPDSTDLLRRIEQLLRLGTVDQVDHAAQRCRVRSGALLSTWVPWICGRAGTTTRWSPPTVGEQCLLLSPGGDTAAAVAVLGLYSSAATPPSTDPAHHETRYADGAWIRYDQSSHTLHAQLPAGSTASLQATHVSITADTLTITADTTITGHVALHGTLDSDQDVTASGISLTGHVHGGIKRGVDRTDTPE